ncbi:hypothetical protein KIPB_009457 [Kipferlia bialata]|uniref:B box-type domain-containing protein n=1 Tax=Kipferlia bialata TaxID=797122 RepID=A0A9K3D2D6_9EUKA|nr:hypothetical protein KIPB_009457 [Kipferlia bialata]|eukprot:g9457.t1
MEYGKHAPVVKGSDEWAGIEYRLQFSLNNSNAKITGAWAVENPLTVRSFEERTRDSMVVDSWLNTMSLTDDNSVQTACERGFKVGPEGFLIATGSLSLESQRPRQRNMYEFLLCRVGLGRSLVRDEMPDRAAAKRTGEAVIPETYDSLYIHQEASGLPTMAERLHDLEEGHPGPTLAQESADQVNSSYLYLVGASEQILPRYIVEVEVSEGEAAPVCEMCAERPATLYCMEDKSRFCEQCDHQFHSQNRIVARHHRMALSEHGAYLGECPQHPGTIAEYYDPILETPVCVTCKMEGTHSSGEAATHRLISLRDAYKRAVTSSTRDDPLLVAKQSDAERQLRNVDERLREVYRNSASVEEDLFSQFQAVLLTLQEETQRKIAALLGDEVELRRQGRILKSADAWLEQERRTLPPCAFMVAYKRHLQLRSDLIDDISIPESGGRIQD